MSSIWDTFSALTHSIWKHHIRSVHPLLAYKSQSTCILCDCWDMQHSPKYGSRLFNVSVACLDFNMCALGLSYASSCDLQDFKTVVTERDWNKTKPNHKNSTKSISISELLSQREIESCLSFQDQQQTRVRLKLLRGASSRAGQGNSGGYGVE